VVEQQQDGVIIHPNIATKPRRLRTIIWTKRDTLLRSSKERPFAITRVLTSVSHSGRMHNAPNSMLISNPVATAPEMPSMSAVEQSTQRPERRERMDRKLRNSNIGAIA